MPPCEAAGLAPEALAGLFRRIREGDRDAFLALTRAYQQKVFALAYAFFRDKDDALDLVQETFLRLFQKIDSYEEGRSFEAWLLQVARNLCIDRYRKERSRRVLEAPLPVDDLPVAAAGAEEAVHASDLRDILSRCVEKLSERQRQIFILRHYSQLKNEEIARSLGLSLGTVKSLHFKALQRLRVLMEPYLECRT
jgi:RNA polymerase sigma-70 factor (ECF subfamily)